MPVTIYVYERGATRRVDQVEPAWLDPSSGVVLWVDLDSPTPEEAHLLRDVFRFHELAVEDAISEIHHPKVDSYDGYVYVILHGIDLKAASHRFATQDTDFFLARHYLVTVHSHKTRSIAEVRELCGRAPHVLADGPAGLMHRIVDRMVDNYRPEVEKLEERLEKLEKEVFLDATQSHVQRVLGLKRDLAALRRVVVPQRDIVARLARREFAEIDDQVGYRFRDVHDHLVRLTEEAFFLQDRTTGLLEANLANISNRLNSVMKILTVFSTIFLPLSVLTGLYGMNVTLPHLPGGETMQFWWVLVLMAMVAGLLLWMFRRFDWL